MPGRFKSRYSARGGRNPRSSSVFAGSAPFFLPFTQPGFEQLMSPHGQNVQQQLAYYFGATPVASYRADVGAVPHVQTAPGVLESAYRQAGLEDPRQALWDQMVGRSSESQSRASTPGQFPAQFNPQSLLQALAGDNRAAALSAGIVR